MVAAIDPPMTMMTACSLMNICRSPPMNIIKPTTAVPNTNPTLVMISMRNSNAHANDRPFWTVARPIRVAQHKPYVRAIKDALPNLVGITIG